MLLSKCSNLEGPKWSVVALCRAVAGDAPSRSRWSGALLTEWPGRVSTEGAFCRGALRFRLKIHCLGCWVCWVIATKTLTSGCLSSSTHHMLWKHSWAEYYPHSTPAGSLVLPSLCSEGSIQRAPKSVKLSLGCFELHLGLRDLSYTSGIIFSSHKC